MSTRSERSRLAILAMAAAFVVVLAGVAGWAVFGHSGSASGPEIGGAFSLIDKNGRPVTDRDLRGRYALIYFGYTFCPDVCPTTLNTMAAAVDLLGSQATQLTPVFVTVDPRRDTPRVVGDYVAAFSPRLLGLTGTAEQVTAATGAFRVYAAPHRTGPGPDDYTMDHTSLLYLMAPDGRFVTPIRADQTPAAMAADLKRNMT